MRRLLTFECEGSTLGASLDDAAGPVGLLMMIGGTQIRIGSHRMFERLAQPLARQGHPCFRFDRRGVGDSEGDDPGFRGSAPDLRAAAAAFREQCAGLDRIVGFGLCDGATTLALSGAEAGLAGMILVNPWLVEAKADAPPAAAARRRYRQRLLSRSAWKRLLTGGASYRKTLAGLRRAASFAPSPLASEVKAALDRSAMPVEFILARGDATAIAAEAEWRSFSRGDPHYLETDSHTFAGPGDQQALLHAVTAALRRF